MVNNSGPVTTVVLPLPIKDCWPYFRDPALIREWHGWEYDSDGGLDGEIEEIFVEGATVGEDHRSINLGTHLFTFSEEGGSTRVEVVRAPVEEGSEAEGLIPFLPEIDEGWTSFLQQLRFKLERHRDASRRTVFYGGNPQDPTISPIQWLGLGQVGMQKVGATYGATVGPGDALTGELWFTAPHQIGVTVEGWGDGLLIVSEGPEGGPPYTKGQALLTTYGLDDEEYTDLADRWSAWWGRHY